MVAKKVAPEGNAEDPCIFRSYANNGSPQAARRGLGPTTPGLASKDPIWKIGRATAAAPTYFDPMKIGDDLYSDGGMGYNNPAEEGYSEVLHKEGFFQRSDCTVPIRLFLSIGTGGSDQNRPPDNPTQTTPTAQPNGKKKKRKRRFILGHLGDLGARLQKEVVKAEAVDRRMREVSFKERWPYVRWTGGEDLAKLDLDKWKSKKRGKKKGDEEKEGKKKEEKKKKKKKDKNTQTEIEGWIHGYMNDPIRREEVKKIAKILVDVRRKRIRHDGDRWQSHTYCSHLICPNCNTNDYRKTGTEAQLQKHFEEDEGHPDTVDLSGYSRFAPKVDGGPW